MRLFDRNGVPAEAAGAHEETATAATAAEWSQAEETDQPIEGAAAGGAANVA
jgi:hypothetical protein